MLEKNSIRFIMKRHQTIIRKNHMEQIHFITNTLYHKYTLSQIHFITKLLELTDPKLWIPSIGLHIRKLSLNWTMRLHLALIVEVKWRNMTFKKRLRSLTSKRLVCLLEFFLESAVLTAISARKWWCLKLISSRKISRFIRCEIDY